MENKEVNLLDYGVVLVKWRRLFIVNFLVVCTITAIISLVMPKWYRSTAILLPPEDSNMDAMNLASLVSNLPIKGLGLNLGSNQVTSYLAILQSRTVREELALRFDLQKVYEKKDIEKTLEKLDQNVEFTVGKEGQVVIQVLDKSPQRAADMANAFVTLLDSLNKDFKITRARNHRLLVEARFHQNLDTLRKVEQELKLFQEKHGVIDIPEQTKAAILGAAELQAKVFATEIELGVKEKYLKADHASIVEGRATLRELNRKLDEMEGIAVPPTNNGHAKTTRLFIPFTRVPDLILQYARLYREVLVQNKLYEFLFQMYEQAKIQEAKDSPTVQVLDPGKVAIRKARPKRMIMVLVAGLLSMVLTGMYVFSREYLNSLQARGGETAEKIDWIKNQVRRDVKFWRKSSS